MKLLYILPYFVVANVFAVELKPPMEPVEIQMDQPYIYGYFSKATETEIEIKELLNLKCFYSFDYFDDNSITQEKMDKANPENLPWCEDLSGGTLHKLTGKKIIYKTDKFSKFYEWNLESEKPLNTLSREAFVKKLIEAKELIKLKLRDKSKDIIDTIQTVYTD